VRRSPTPQCCQRAAMRMRPAEYLAWRPCPYIGYAEAIGRTFRRFLKAVTGLGDGPMHGIARWVATEDLNESFSHCNGLALWARRHVDHGEDIQLVRIRLRELCQGISQAAFLSLEPSARVIRDQGDDTRRCTLTCQPSRTVDWMETGVRNCLAIAHIVKPSSRDDSVRDIEAALLKVFGRAANRLHMHPPIAHVT
jgi:hypothetical protein